MDGDLIARMIYVGILVLVLGGWFFANNRASLNKTLQQAIVWVFLFIGVIVIYGLWDDIRRSTTGTSAAQVSGDTITLPQARDGHYYVEALVEGQPIDFVIDTGATAVVLTMADAERLGYKPNELDYVGRSMTANGEVRTAPVTIGTLAIGPITETSVAATVNQGELDISLLGMSFLRRFAKIEIANGKMILTR